MFSFNIMLLLGILRFGWEAFGFAEFLQERCIEKLQYCNNPLPAASIPTTALGLTHALFPPTNHPIP
jgi:hypothetical protein